MTYTAHTTEELFSLCEKLPDNATLSLLPGKTYDVYSDRCPVYEGYHFSNTAGYDENPRGFRPVCLYMKGKKHITIEGNGATFLIHGVMTPFLFDACEDLTLRDFTIDHAHPTMGEFTIEENTGCGRYRIRIAKDNLFDIADNRILWHGECGQNGEYLWQFDYRDEMVLSMHKSPKTEFVQMMGIDTNRFPAVPEFASIEADPDDGHLLEVTLKDHNAFFPVGETVQSRNTVRDQIGGAFVHCQRVVCERLTVRAMHGLGLLGQFTRDMRYDGLVMTPGEGRTVASNADFFQFSGCSGLCEIKNCICSDAHDDFVNAHGTHLKIVEAAENRLLVRFMHFASRGFQAFFDGDEIELINHETLLPYGSAHVLHAEVVNDTDHVLTLTDALPADVRIGDVVENATWTPTLFIHHNRFGPSTGRGVLCTTRKPVMIENNVFYKTGGNVLCIEDDCNFWYESGYTTDVTFRNNEIMECGYGSLGRGAVPVISVNPQVLVPTENKNGTDIPVYVHGDIRVTDNRFTFTDRVSTLVDVKYTKHFVFRGNTCNRTPTFACVNVENLDTDIT